MARTITTETTVYTYAELSDAAKERAREQWNRFLWEDGSMQESIEMNWEGVLTDAGWTDLSDLTYDLYSQGGYPAWTGTLPAFEHDGRTWTLRTDNRGGRYSRSLWIEDDESDPDGEYGSPNLAAYTARLEAAEEAARSHVHALSEKLLYAFRDEDEYQCSDEVMTETAEVNGYEYTEDGKLA